MVPLRNQLTHLKLVKLLRNYGWSTRRRLSWLRNGTISEHRGRQNWRIIETAIHVTASYCHNRSLEMRPADLGSQDPCSLGLAWRQVILGWCAFYLEGNNTINRRNNYRSNLQWRSRGYRNYRGCMSLTKLRLIRRQVEFSVWIFSIYIVFSYPISFQFQLLTHILRNK